MRRSESRRDGLKRGVAGLESVSSELGIRRSSSKGKTVVEHIQGNCGEMHFGIGRGKLTDI